MPGSPTRTSNLTKGPERFEVLRFRAQVVAGPDAGAEAESDAGRLTVGVADDVTLRLRDATVSRYHLELESTADGVVLRDLGSKNGTRLGSSYVREIVARESLEVAIGDSRLRLVIGQDTAAVPLSSSTSFGGLLGASPAMRAVFAALEAAAPTHVPVLLLGESGTGKELAARALHGASARAKGPFEVVDCGGLSPTLVESELFGHERGAFTGADRDRVGAFERADGGTLFLDELGELPLEVQPKLLRALGEREVRPVGGQRSRRVDVRVVAATNRDLRREVNHGAFRPDLYFRLAVIQVRMPALRDRLEDLPALVSALLQSIEPEVGRMTNVDVDVEALYQHGWPGNVRELRNYLQQLVVLRAPPPLLDGGAIEQRWDRQPLHKAMDRFERAYLQRCLQEAKGNVAEAANRAGINRATMYRSIQRHGIKVTE